jgi:hypothetical protein
MKKPLIVVLAISLILLVLSGAQAHVFNFRTHKGRPSVSGTSLDNLPHIYCCSRAEYGYSGIFVGDTVRVSGEVEDSRKSIELKFPSGKTVNIPVKNHYFEKDILFNEEGLYYLDNHPFEVSYRAVLLPPTKTVKSILKMEPARNDEYTETFTNWNNACVVEDGKSEVAHILLTDQNGNPLPNLKTQKFTTDKYGIAAVPFSSKDINIYGNIKAAKYDKIVFDENGNITYATKKKNLFTVLYKDNTLFVDANEFLLYTLSPNFYIPKNELEIGANYIFYKPANIAFPAKVIEKDGKTYVSIEPMLALINEPFFNVLGVSIRYYPDRTEVYIIKSNVK